MGGLRKWDLVLLGFAASCLVLHLSAYQCWLFYPLVVIIPHAKGPSNWLFSTAISSFHVSSFLIYLVVMLSLASRFRGLLCKFSTNFLFLNATPVFNLLFYEVISFVYFWADLSREVCCSCRCSCFSQCYLLPYCSEIGFCWKGTACTSFCYLFVSQ